MPKRKGFRLPTYLLLGSGILFVSFSGILVKISHSPPSRIALYRILFATLFYGLFLPLFPRDSVSQRSAKTPLLGKPVLLGLLAGFFLALHFRFWIEAFSHTSVAGSVIPLAIQPVLVWVLSLIFLKEGFSGKMVLPLVLVSSGMLLLSAGDLVHNPSFAKGDLFSLAGTLFVSVFLVIGRKLVPRFGAYRFNFVAYATASIWVLLFSLFDPGPLLLSGLREWSIAISLGGLCSFLGYLSITHALKTLPAPTVAVALVGEPVLSITWAWLLLGEVATLPQALGFSVGLVGMLLFFRNLKKRRSPKAPPIM